MLQQELVQLVGSALHSSSPSTTDDEDEFMEKLRFFFDDNVILAALDLLDRDNVVRLTTNWSHYQYQVLGNTSTHMVYIDDTTHGWHRTAYCTCPAFAYSVLLSDGQFMCKHLLATVLGIRLSRCVERSIGPNDLAALARRQAGL